MYSKIKIAMQSNLKLCHLSRNLKSEKTLHYEIDFKVYSPYTRTGCISENKKKMSNISKGAHVMKISRGNVILQIGKTFWGYFAKLYHILYRSILNHIWRTHIQPYLLYLATWNSFFFRPITHAFLLLMHIAVRQISRTWLQSGRPRGGSSRPDQYLPLPCKRPDLFVARMNT